MSFKGIPKPITAVCRHWPGIRRVGGFRESARNEFGQKAELHEAFALSLRPTKATAAIFQPEDYEFISSGAFRCRSVLPRPVMQPLIPTRCKSHLSRRARPGRGLLPQYPQRSNRIAESCPFGSCRKVTGFNAKSLRWP